MHTYIALVDYTEQGMDNITDSPDRLDDAKALAESMGGELTDWYLTFGEHDAVAIGEFPDDETYARFALAVNSLGYVQTRTLKAFTESEYVDLVAGIPEQE